MGRRVCPRRQLEGATKETRDRAERGSVVRGSARATVVAEEHTPADPRQRSIRRRGIHESMHHFAYLMVTIAGSLRTLTSDPRTALSTPSTAAERIGCSSGLKTTTPP